MPSEYVEAFLIILGFVIVTAIVLSLGFWVAEYACETRWRDRDSAYHIAAGCMVEYDGRMVPEDRVWFERNG